MSRLVLVCTYICLILVGSCGPIKAPTKPYDGLNATSYGPLYQRQPISCNPAERELGPVTDWVTTALAKLAAPTEGALTYDQTLINEGLQDQFRFIADSGQATVVVLDRNNRGITFWFSLGLVAPYEVENAARKFCKYTGRSPSLLGYAQICGSPIKAPFLINNQQSLGAPTYVIASFACD